jgi:predicted PhzF superfamily epimerase YddE/YHI9
MNQRLTVVDAFTDRPFSGNPAAVCVLEAPRSEPWMQDVAREMNLSETAFLAPRGDGWSLRWFTPVREVALCGHATLASAHVLWTEDRAAPDSVLRFHTESGLLTACRRGDWIELDFPATPAPETAPPDGLAEALGTGFRFVGRSAFDYLVEVDTEETVRGLDPNLSALAEVSSRGFLVTARAGAASGFDFVSRCFFPDLGIPEDPVTGSAHCALGPHWSARLGKTEMLACQASPRGGTVRVRMENDRVVLGGQAVTVLRSELAAG